MLSSCRTVLFYLDARQNWQPDFHGWQKLSLHKVPRPGFPRNCRLEALKNFFSNEFTLFLRFACRAELCQLPK